MERARFASVVVSWLVTTGWIAGGLGAAIDGALLAFHAAPGRALVAGAATAWSFGVWVGALAAATIGVCGALLARIGSPARRSWLEVGLSSLAALACATFVVQPWRHGIVEPYWVIVVLAAAIVALLVWLARAQPRAQARVFALLLALPPLGMDIWLAPSAYPELHDLALLVAGAALASAFSDARAALADGRWKHTWTAALVMLAAALAIHQVVSAHWFPPGDFGFARFEGSADAARVTRALLAHLPAATARPMLLWGHYSEPHAPRTLHPEQPVPDGPAHLPPDYRGALAHLDRELVPLLAALAARDGLSRTVLIVTSDHGEGLGEHGIDGHGRSGYEEIVAIPALLHAPGMPAGHYAQLVSQRDLPATILGAFGLHDETLAAEAFGRSWLRLRSDPKLVLHEHVVLSSMRFSTGRYGAVPLWILVAPRFKLVASFDDGMAELFDRATDPRERQDLTFAHPAVARDLRRALARYTDIEPVPPARARLR